MKLIVFLGRTSIRCILLRISQEDNNNEYHNRVFGYIVMNERKSSSCIMRGGYSKVLTSLLYNDDNDQ